MSQNANKWVVGFSFFSPKPAVIFITALATFIQTQHRAGFYQPLKFVPLNKYFAQKLRLLLKCLVVKWKKVKSNIYGTLTCMHTVHCFLLWTCRQVLFLTFLINFCCASFRNINVAKLWTNSTDACPLLLLQPKLKSWNFKFSPAKKKSLHPRT